MKINLDACPFCGGKARITAFTTDENDLQYRLYCETCEVFSPFFGTLEACENWWNNRVFSEKDAKLIVKACGKHEHCAHCEDCRCRDIEDELEDMEHGFMPHPESEYEADPF